MRRIYTTVVALLAAPALLAGCDGEQVLVGADEDCADLIGEFRATEFEFVSTFEEDLIRDFDAEGTTFALELREDRTFASTFLEPGTAPLQRTGTFAATPTELVLGERALFAGAEDDVSQLFGCERLSDDRFLLTSDDIGFDFDGDLILEEATFEGEFEAI